MSRSDTTLGLPVVRIQCSHLSMLPRKHNQAPFSSWSRVVAPLFQVTRLWTCSHTFRFQYASQEAQPILPLEISAGRARLRLSASYARVSPNIFKLFLAISMNCKFPLIRWHSPGSVRPRAFVVAATFPGCSARCFGMFASAVCFGSLLRRPSQPARNLGPGNLKAADWRGVGLCSNPHVSLPARRKRS